jgi:hypothetical protein
MTGACDSCSGPVNSTNVGQRVSTINYSIACEDRNDTVSRIVHVRDRPVVSVLRHDLGNKKIYVSFSIGVKGSAGAIDGSSFKIGKLHLDSDVSASSDVQSLGEYRGHQNVYRFVFLKLLIIKCRV